MSVTVLIQNASSDNDVPNVAQVEKWANAALVNQEQDLEVGLRIVNEDEGRALNQQWRNKDYATNVLSFPLGEPISEAPELLGDLVICAPIVSREAKEQGKETEAHWAHLVVHGMLHLQGYDHEQEKEAEEMETLEITILDKIGYANPYEITLNA